MNENARNELRIRVPEWTEVARIEREARAYRNAYIAASARRVWKRLTGAIAHAAPAEHRHA